MALLQYLLVHIHCSIFGRIVRLSGFLPARHGGVDELSFERLIAFEVRISTVKASNHTTCIPLSIYKLLTCSTNPFYPLIYTHSKKYAPVDPKIPNIHSPRLFPNVSTTVHQIHISSINSHFLHLPGPTNTSNLRSH